MALSAFQQSAEAADCADVARQVSRDVGARPERVLVIVEDTLVVSDACACEVVKSAITAASASAKLAGQIVYVAVNAAPSKVDLITECAKAVSPDAGSEIDAAVRKALGSQSNRKSDTTAATVADTGSSGKEPASKNPVSKNPIPPDPLEPETSDFGLSPVAIGGVYLVYPGGGSSTSMLKDDKGRLYFVGPGGRRVYLDPPKIIIKKHSPPRVVIIRPPTPTSSDDTPEDDPSIDDFNEDNTPIDPPPGDEIPADELPIDDFPEDDTPIDDPA